VAAGRASADGLAAGLWLMAEGATTWKPSV